MLQQLSICVSITTNLLLLRVPGETTAEEDSATIWAKGGEPGLTSAELSPVFLR